MLQVLFLLFAIYNLKLVEDYSTLECQYGIQMSRNHEIYSTGTNVLLTACERMNFP